MFKANEQQNKCKYCLPQFSLYSVSVGILYGHFTPGAEDTEVFMMLVCRGFFSCLLLETWLWRDFQGEERNVLGDGETDKDSVWIMHILEHSPLGSRRTWVVDDWRRRPWTVALWDLFIYQCSLPGRLIIRQKSLERSLFLFSSYKFWTNKITVFSSAD